MQAAGVLGIDLQTFERLVAHIAGVFDATARTLSQRISSDRSRQAEVTFSVPGIGLDGAARVKLARLEVVLPGSVIFLEFSKVDC